MSSGLPLFALLACLVCSQAVGMSPMCGGEDSVPLNSFLWTIKRPAPVYFFGTIHVPYTRVWDYIPQNTKDAFRDAENIFFELDLTNHYTAAELANCQQLPDGKTLSSVLPRDLYRRLRRHFDYLKRKMPEWMGSATGDAGFGGGWGDGGGQPLYADFQFNAMAGSWERMRPVWVMLTLNSLTESEVRSFGVPVLDLYLSQQAVRWSKRTGAIEKVEEQCTPLNQLSLSQVVFALNQTLLQHEAQRLHSVSLSVNDDLIRHYSCGDLNSVLFSRDAARAPSFGASGGRAPATTAPSPEEARMAREIDGYFQTELLYKRNERMAERVATLLREHPRRSFFFAFGAGHFLGNNTIIDHLRSSGFTVDHLSADHPVPSSSNQEFSSDHDLPVPLNPYMEALASFDKVHSGRIRQKLNKQSRRQPQPSGTAHKIQGDRQRGKDAATSSSFQNLWVRIEKADDVTRESGLLEVVTSTDQSWPALIWHSSHASLPGSLPMGCLLVAAVVTLALISLRA